MSGASNSSATPVTRYQLRFSFVIEVMCSVFLSIAASLSKVIQASAEVAHGVGTVQVFNRSAKALNVVRMQAHLLDRQQEIVDLKTRVQERTNSVNKLPAISRSCLGQTEFRKLQGIRACGHVTQIAIVKIG